MEPKRGDLVRIILDKQYYLVPVHGWFELEDGLGEFFNKKYGEDVPSIGEVIGYVSGGNLNSYYINPFGFNTLQLTESGAMSTGIREGDIVVYKDKIKGIEKVK